MSAGTNINGHNPTCWGCLNQNRLLFANYWSFWKLVNFQVVSCKFYPCVVTICTQRELKVLLSLFKLVTIWAAMIGTQLGYLTCSVMSSKFKVTGGYDWYTIFNLWT